MRNSKNLLIRVLHYEDLYFFRSKEGTFRVVGLFTVYISFIYTNPWIFKPNYFFHLPNLMDCNQFPVLSVKIDEDTHPALK